MPVAQPYAAYYPQYQYPQYQYNAYPVQQAAYPVAPQQPAMQQPVMPQQAQPTSPPVPTFSNFINVLFFLAITCFSFIIFVTNCLADFILRSHCLVKELKNLE